MVGFSTGILLIVYLENFKILNQSKEGAERDLYIVSEMLENCEFLINEETSIGDASSGYRVFGSDRQLRQPLPFAWVGESPSDCVKSGVTQSLSERLRW